ncbi:unnamed protein product [Heterosigma akashiwo]
MNKGYFWTNMTADLEDYIQKCKICQECKNPPPRLRTKIGKLQRPMASQPFQVIHMDACTIRSRNIIMIFVDQFSSYVELQLMRGPITGRSLSEAFITCVVCRHSTPAIVIADNVSYQVNGTFPQVLKTLGVRLMPVTVYHPEANGRAERMVSVVKKTLKTMAYENVAAWEKLIPLAAFACNTAQHRVIGEAPFFLVHGRDAILPGPVNTALETLKSSAEVSNPDLYALNLRDRILTAFERTTQKLQAVQNEHTHPDLLEEKYKVGDKVRLLDVRKATGDNLKPMWKGPFQIIQVVSAAVYRIQDPQKPGHKPTLVHINRLKKAA